MSLLQGQTQVAQQRVRKRDSKTVAMDFPML